MRLFPVGELARALFPSEMGRVIAVMLRSYFDDSGTHSSSEVVVWGGLVGTEAQFLKLEAEWEEMLREPLPGKPRLSKFSVGKCRHAEGEFAYYRPEERDALRYRVREIIADSNVGCIAYGIPARLYNSIIRGRARRDFGGPSGVAFASCVDMSMQVSEKLGKAPLVCIFDKGQESENLWLYLRDAEGRAAGKSVPVSYAFAPVVGTPGLQAADTIATEHYWHGLECLKADPPEAKPHFWSLLKMTDAVGWTLSAEELHKMRDDYYRMHPIRNWFRRPRRKL